MKTVSNSILCIAHWLYERELAECESEYPDLEIGTEEQYITNIVTELEKLKPESPLFMAIWGEYMRQHPYYDGNWWEEGRPWNSRKRIDGTWYVRKWDPDLQKYVITEGICEK